MFRSVVIGALSAVPPLVVPLLVGPTLAAQDPGIARYVAGRFAEDAPGCVVAVVEDGKILATHARGVAEVGRDRTIDADSAFYLASVSKQFTAACVHLLQRRNELSLDDSVRKFVPGLPDYADGITVRHLIHHRSGLRDCFELMVLAKMDVHGAHSHADVLELVCRQQGLNFEPGTEFLYSNTGYLLLAEIVEAVSGQSLREFAHENLFEPLGMARTGFRDAPDQRFDGLVAGHEVARGEVRSVTTKFHLVGSGGVVSTAGDLAKWATELDRGELLGEDFVATLQAPIELGVDDGRDPKLGLYAAGMLIGDFGGQRTVWHPGGSLGFSTCLVRIPERQLSIIVLCNSSSGPARTVAFDLAARHIGSPRSAAPTPVAEGPRDGRHVFRHPRTNEIVVSIVRGKRVKLATAAWDVPMRAVDATSIASVDTALPIAATFVYHDDGPADLRLQIGAQAPFVCQGLQLERVAPEKVESLVGTWRSEEAGASLTFAPGRGGVRIADQLQLDPGVLYALQPDLFVANDGSFTLETDRDPAGDVTTVWVSTKGARRLRYTR